jgi:hypothetical protein
VKMSRSLRYDVQVVADSDLPAGVQRVLVERRGDDPLLLVANSAAGTIRLIAESARVRDCRAQERPLRIVV